MVSSMLRKFIARSVYSAAASRFTSPLMSTGAYLSTLPSSFTLARDAGLDDSPVTVR